MTRPTTTLHVLTTGESLLRKIADRRDDEYRHLARALQPGPAGPDTVHEMLLAARDFGGTRLAVDGLLSAEAVEGLAALPAEAAAEWTSVDVDRKAGPALPFESFVFLASDTDLGLRAATFLAAGLDRDIHYVADPLRHSAGWVGPGSAWICRVPGLDLGRDRALPGSTWRALGAVGRLVAASVEQDPVAWTVVIHYSGGYKAVIPHVMVLAEALRSRLRGTGVTVRAMALHESALDHDVRIRVEVPVRALPPDLWHEVGTLRAALRDGSDLVPRHTRVDGLDGLMVERDSAHWRVTAPGLISTHVR